MSPTLKRLLHWLGSAIAILGVLFVVQRLGEYRLELNLARFDGANWTTFAALTIAYASANFLLGLAWWHLLGGLGAYTSRTWALRAYGISQLAKYVPGNIFHLAGRQALGMADALPAWPLAKSVVWELGLLSVAGALFAFLALPWLLTGLAVPWAMLAFGCAVGIVSIGLNRIPGRRFANAFGLQVTFLTCSGLIFIALVGLVSTSGIGDFYLGVKLAGAFVLAWLVGLITPGAPAGLGVRELVLLFLLKGAVQESDLLLAVVLGRVVTVVGDLLFFGIAALLKRDTSRS